MNDRNEGQKLAWRLWELAGSLGTSIGFLRNEIKRGALIARKCSRTIIVLDSDLQAYLDERCVVKQPIVPTNLDGESHVEA